MQFLSITLFYAQPDLPTHIRPFPVKPTPTSTLLHPHPHPHPHTHTNTSKHIHIFLVHLFYYKILSLRSLRSLSYKISSHHQHHLILVDTNSLSIFFTSFYLFANVLILTCIYLSLPFPKNYVSGLKFTKLFKKDSKDFL